jgi:protein dithiol oxidoreductase (disulfide-forming)
MSHRTLLDRRHFVAVAALLPLVVQAQGKGGQPVELRDYRPVNPPQPTEGSKIEVLEFFQYSCPHCYAFNADLERWKKTLPADVEFKRVAINWDGATLNHTKTYYALEQLNRLDIHEKFFSAIHNGRRRMLDVAEIADFMANNGIDKARWTENFNSFTVNTRSSRAGQIWRAYKIDGTPAMAVGGRFVTAPSMVGSREGTTAVLDFLIARVRSEKRK